MIKSPAIKTKYKLIYNFILKERKKVSKNRTFIDSNNYKKGLGLHIITDNYYLRSCTELSPIYSLLSE